MLRYFLEVSFYLIELFRCKGCVHRDNSEFIGVDELFINLGGHFYFKNFLPPCIEMKLDTFDFKGPQFFRVGRHFSEKEYTYQ
jgi:hypothetical protein